jgi:hypothetical protein
MEPDEWIDRAAEQELFGEMLSAAPEARLLTISDAGARGKSTLLRRLQYNCRFVMRPRVAACIVELDQVTPTVFGFVAQVVDNLPGDARARFARFNKLNDARKMKKAEFFEGSGGISVSGQPQIRGQVEVGDSSGEATGVKIKDSALVLPNPLPFTSGHEEVAQRMCVEAFFEDLRVLCSAEKVVVMLDSWDRCEGGLAEWLREEFLMSHCLNEDRAQRPKLLSVVVAGRPYHPREEKCGLRPDEFRNLVPADEDPDKVIRSIRSLSEWDANHVREFVKLNGYGSPSDLQVEFFRELLRDHGLVTLKMILMDMNRDAS